MKKIITFIKNFLQNKESKTKQKQINKKNSIDIFNLLLIGFEDDDYICFDELFIQKTKHFKENILEIGGFEDDECSLYNLRLVEVENVTKNVFISDDTIYYTEDEDIMQKFKIIDEIKT